MVSFTKDEKIEVFRKAASLVRAGWCQKRYAKDAADSPTSWYFSGAVKFCMQGALLQSSFLQLSFLTGYPVGTDFVYAYCPLVAQECVTWNDTPGRTAEEVAVLLDWKADELISFDPAENDE